MDNLEGTPPWSPFQLMGTTEFASCLLTGGEHVREERRNDVWDGFVEDLDTTLFSTWWKFSGRNLTATIDIPSTQNWKAMKTTSRKGFNTGVAD